MLPNVNEYLQDCHKPASIPKLYKPNSNAYFTLKKIPMIDYQKTLNEAQYSAVTTQNPSVLVVAGAGSGKTRTIVFRLAWLAEQGIDPSSMLLLTFTRKASREMLIRAHNLLEHDLVGIHGGTFHSFAFHILQIWHPEWLGNRSFTLMDSGDITDAIKTCKATKNIGKGERSFPKTPTIVSLFSKSRNKGLSIRDLIEQESYQLLPYVDDLVSLYQEYEKYRHERALMDYDDLLFELETLIRTNEQARDYLHHSFRHILVDEYQDTNIVQAQIVHGLTFDREGTQQANIMAVGDESQSIYAFRGATIRNIIDFPKLFPNTEIIRLEENFRSTQPILDVANVILSHADESFQKKLFTRKTNGKSVRLFFPKNEEQQAEACLKKIKTLLKTYTPEEIAVLFRAGFHSYSLELLLNRDGIPFRKYGGLKYIEAAHVKDCIAFARLIINPLDMPSFSRIASMHSGIGPKTIEKIFGYIRQGDEKSFDKAVAKNKGLAGDLSFIDSLRKESHNPATLIAAITDYFQPRLESRYPDDWPSRKQSLDEVVLTAQNYTNLDDYIADLVLESGQDSEKDLRGHILLSTIHSAKGLEWEAVLLIDLINDRFPSHHALSKKADFEEERRLMYVACTRARKELFLYSPRAIFNRQLNMSIPADPSPFICEMMQDVGSDSFKYPENEFSEKDEEYEDYDPDYD